MARFNIDWLGKRNYMFAISGILIAVAIAAIVVRGITLSVEFVGGTVVEMSDTADVTNDQVTKAFEDAGVANPGVQSTLSQDVKGFIVRTEVTDSDAALASAQEAAASLKLPESSIRVTTIGPGWGENITNAALFALTASILAILLYISIRFEYKMSVTAVIALAHDILITLGLYAAIGQEVSPSTIAALLTILGYSLYDTVVVFHRIKENSQHLAKQTFMQMANESINEVIVRSLNTTVTSLLPVVIMLIIGGEALQDFALALVIGLAVGAFSSIAVATPIFVLWKETEPRFAALKKKYAA